MLALSAALGAVLVVLAVPASALAAAPKVILPSAGVNNDEPTVAELNAAIRSGGFRTRYEFWVDEGGTGVEVGEGELSASELERSVSARATGLLPSHTYIWEVVAENEDGSARGGGEFTTFPELPPSPCSRGCSSEGPVEIKQERWVQEAEERDAAEAPRLEAERMAKKREEEERPAKEAAALAAKEREAREAGERAAREAILRERSAGCRVPRVRGDTLSVASAAIRRAHCRLGSVRKPKHSDGPLVVIAQGTKEGTRPGKHAVISLTLGPAPKRSKRH